MYKEFLEKIKEYNRIIIHRHVRPDGDCMGSQMGLKSFIKYNFPDKEVYAVGDQAPDYINHLGTIDNIPDEYYNGALVIVVDTGTPERICDDRWKKGSYIIKIDHHDDSPEYGNICYIDPDSPSCASIIVRIIKTFDEYVLPKDAAYALYLGITTDTGRFRYRGVNGEVLCNAGYLVDQGIDIQKLYNDLYIDDVNTLKLQGYVLNNFKTTENGVVYIHFTKKMMKKFGVSKEDAGNLVNSLSSIRGCMIWVAFIDQLKDKDPKCSNKKEAPEKEIRCRIRSRFVAINDIASQYRGGGHLQAAGATIYSKKEMNELLQKLDQTLKTYKEANPNAF